MKTCLNCGKQFDRKDGTGPARFARRFACSRGCSNRLRRIPAEKKLAAHTKRNEQTGCLEWQAYRDRKGYGRAAASEYGEVLTHRIAYIVAYGSIPAGLHVLHHCDNPPCCNPAHLYAGTNDDNMADRIARNRNRGAVGERNCKAKLTAEQIAAIRRDSRSQSTIARDYGVHQTMVSAIKRRVSWSHIP